MQATESKFDGFQMHFQVLLLYDHRNIIIRISFSAEVSKTATYLCVISIIYCNLYVDHNPATLQTNRRQDQKLI